MESILKAASKNKTNGDSGLSEGWPAFHKYINEVSGCEIWWQSSVRLIFFLQKGRDSHFP